MYQKIEQKKGAKVDKGHHKRVVWKKREGNFLKNPFKAYVAHVDKHLTPYDVYFTPKEFIAMKGYGLLVGVTVGAIFSSMHYVTYGMLVPSTIMGVSFSILGYLAPNMWVKHLSKQRKKMLDSQLEETLQTIKEKMETEQDLMTVLKTVAEQTTYPIAHDLKRIHEEYTVQNKHIAFEELQNELKKHA